MSLRIGTDGDYAYRQGAIERTADFSDCDKMKAVISACDDVLLFVKALATSSSVIRDRRCVSLVESHRQPPAG